MQLEMSNFCEIVKHTLFYGSLPDNQKKALETVITQGLARGATLPQIACVLGQTYHESMRYLRLVEIASGDAYDTRTDLGNTPEIDGDGALYKGRGLIHLTGKANYRRMSSVVGIDLVKNPRAAEELNNATAIAWEGMVRGMFRGDKIEDYIPRTAKAPYDFYGAREIVNGDKDRLDTTEMVTIGALIDRHCRRFLEALQAAQVKAPVMPKGRPTVAKSKTVIASAGQVATGVASGVGAITALDGTAQAVALGVCGAVILLGIWILRERLSAAAEGWL